MPQRYQRPGKELLRQVCSDLSLPATSVAPRMVSPFRWRSGWKARFGSLQWHVLGLLGRARTATTMSLAVSMEHAVEAPLRTVDEVFSGGIVEA
jgi:hypothetical protein